MKKIITLLALAVVSISCSDDSNLSDGNFGDTPRVVGFLKTTQNVPFFEDEGVVLQEFPFDVLGTGTGAPYDENVTVTYAVNTTATTAVAGVEFDWVNTASTVTIPAGQTFGLLPLNINTGNFSTTEKTSLVLDITAVDKDGFVISAQSKQLTINFIGCLSELQGMYSVFVTRGDGATVTRPNETVSYQGVNYFRTTTSGTFTVAQLSPPAPFAGFYFTDVCGDISVESQNLGNYYSNLLRGLSTTGEDGEVLNANQFEITYEITSNTGNQTYTGVYTRAN